MAMNWLARYELPAAKDPPGDYGPAHFDADGATLLFRGSTVSNGRKYYQCIGCTRICRKYAHTGEADLSTRFISVVEGRIVGRDPDLGGSNYGHLCQKPDVVAMIEEQHKLKNAVTGKKPNEALSGQWKSLQTPRTGSTSNFERPAGRPRSGSVRRRRSCNVRKSSLRRLVKHSGLHEHFISYVLGATLVFTLTSSVTANGRACYCCAECNKILKKYWYIPEVRLRNRSITVVDGRIVGRDPDVAGSDCGHLCQKPDVVDVIEELQYLKREAAAKKSGQGTSIANWLEPYEIPDSHNPLYDFGPAQFNDYGHLKFQSRLHAGATLLFRRSSTSATGKTYYYCGTCESIFRKYQYTLLGLRRRNVTVVDDRIVGRDPDVAGSDCGHICQMPHMVAMIEANLKRVNRRQSAIANELSLVAAGNQQLQENDDDIIFAEEVPGAARKKREQTKSYTTQIGINDGSSAGRASTSRRPHEPQAGSAPRKRAKTDCAALGPSKVPSATAQEVQFNVSGAVGNAPPVAVTRAGDKFEGFQPVFGKAVPAGPTSVKFEYGALRNICITQCFRGEFGTYTFELAKEGSRLVGGVWVPIKSYRCVECFKAMERAGRRQDVPFVLVVNGSFVKRDPEFPMGTNHFCSPGGN
ncbi:hypothetical protein AAVH_06682 [Aphelenchoides avenae]|nr:hypothetical protein AAVH_06682 [Aphelenchus avenae]